ncbi:MAG: MFS transporter, partial [Lentisphaeria bacterium]
KTSLPFSRKKRHYTVFLFALGVMIYFIVNIQRVAVPGQIFNELQSDLQISATSVANLGSAFMYVYAVTQLLVGLLVDKYGGMRVLGLGSVLMSVGAVLFPLSDSLNTLLLSRMLVGVGCGTVYLSMVKECDRLYSHNFTAVMGLVVFLGYFGGVAGTFPLAKGTELMGWRTCLLAIGLAGGVVLLLIAAIWKKAQHPSIIPGRITVKPYLYGFTNLNNLKCVSSYSVNFGIYYAILTVVGKKFLEDIGGLSSGAAAFSCTVMVILSAIMNQVSGLLSAYTGNLRRPYFRCLNLFPMLGSGMLVIGLFCKGSEPGWGAFFVVAFIMISLTSGFSPITNTLARETNPPSATGVAVGITNFSAYIMVAIFGSLVGLVLDCFQSKAAITSAGVVVYPATAYLCLFSLFFLVSIGTFKVALSYPETYGRNIFTGKTRILQITRFIRLKLHE